MHASLVYDFSAGIDAAAAQLGSNGILLPARKQCISKAFWSPRASV
jgi:hypothetical protein